MKRALQYLLALLIGVLASCKGGSEDVTPVGDNELLVSIDDMQTRSSLYDNVKTKWQLGDKIKLYSVNENEVDSAVYSCVQDGEQVAHFTLISQSAEFDVSKFKAAYYPGENAKGYNKNTMTITATVPAGQTYAVNSFGKGAAPMVSNVKVGEKEIRFRNAFGGVRLEFYTQPTTPASNFTSIILTSETTKLNGTFKFQFTDPNDTTPRTNSFNIIYPTSDGTTSTTLSNGGSTVAVSAVKDAPTSFYVMVPGTANNEKIKMTVTTDNFTYYRTFISNNQSYAADASGRNKLVWNNILKMGKLEVGATLLLSVGVDSWEQGVDETPTLN